MFYEYKDFLPFQSLIQKHFGNVKRAREFYLYTEKKVRLLDMYLNGGRAILGHKPHSVITQYKRELDRGVYGDLPTKRDGELRRALKALFPDYEAVFYAVAETALKSASRLIWDNVRGSKDLSSERKQHKVGEPHTIDFDNIYVPVYRHFLKEDLGYAFLFFPYPSISTTILLTKNTNRIYPEYEEPILPAEQVAISTFIYEVIAKQKRKEEGAIEHSMQSKKALKLERQAQKEMNALLPELAKFFDIEGCYLYFKKKNGMGYEDFFIKALEHHILLSPWEDDPSIFPTLQHYGQLIDFFKSF